MFAPLVCPNFLGGPFFFPPIIKRPPRCGDIYAGALGRPKRFSPGLKKGPLFRVPVGPPGKFPRNTPPKKSPPREGDSLFFLYGVEKGLGPLFYGCPGIQGFAHIFG